jgi:hypothetical protein
MNLFPFPAGPDDCDYNWHLSNSSYPKVSDIDYTPHRPNFRALLDRDGDNPLGLHVHFFLTTGAIIDTRFRAYEERINHFSLLCAYWRLGRSSR